PTRLPEGREPARIPGLALLGLTHQFGSGDMPPDEGPRTVTDQNLRRCQREVQCSGLHGPRGRLALACHALFAKPSRLLRLPVPDTEPAGDDDSLDIGRTTRMLLDDSPPLLRFGEAAHRAQYRVVGQRLRAEEIVNGLGQPKIRCLPEIGHLRSFVGPLLAGVDHPEICGSTTNE